MANELESEIGVIELKSSFAITLTFELTLLGEVENQLFPHLRGK